MSRWATAWRTRDWSAPPEKIGTFRVTPNDGPRLSLPVGKVLEKGGLVLVKVLSPQDAFLPQLPPKVSVGRWLARATLMSASLACNCSSRAFSAGLLSMAVA